MTTIVNAVFAAIVAILMVQNTMAQRQYYYYYTAQNNGCGAQLQDLPNPASDSCTAFFRCYNSRQYSVRCPAGQAFDFDRNRCRPSQLVDCTLQLQRFQAPGVPDFLRPNTNEDPNIQIRVLQSGNSNDPNNLVFLDNDGQQIPVTRQAQAAQSQVRSHPVNPYLTNSIHQSPVAPAQPNQFVNTRGQPQVPRQGQNQFVNTPGQPQVPRQGQNQFVNTPAQSQVPRQGQNQFPTQNQPQGQGQGQFPRDDQSPGPFQGQANTPNINVPLPIAQ